MNLQTRIEKAEAEWIARVRASREAATRAWVDWIETGTPEEQAAYWRVLYAQLSDESSNWTDEQKAAFLGDHIEPTPEDQALADAFQARIPPDLWTRQLAAWGTRLPGEGDADERRSAPGREQMT